MKRNTFLLFALLALISACKGKAGETAETPHPAAKESTLAMKAEPSVASAYPNGAKPQEASGEPDARTLEIGQQIFKGTCSICHKSGLNGAPKIGSKKDWEPRIAQGKEVLYDHSIHGYRGTKGSMPSRGSNPRLSEAEVKAAVDYIVEHAVPAWSVE